MIRKFFLSLCLMATSLGFSGAVSIFNDSPFPLHAQVLAADGRLLGAITIDPQTQKSWNDPNLVENNTPTTPYTVIFYCLEGDEYGIVTDVAEAATVTASSTQGKKICKPQSRKDMKKAEQNRKRNPNLENYNEHQWKTNQIN